MNAGQDKRRQPGKGAGPAPPGRADAEEAGGLPASARKYRELVKENTVSAIRTVLEIMETGKPQERLKAAEIILDRAHGRQAQPVDAEVSGKVKVDILLPPGMDDLLG